MTKKDKKKRVLIVDDEEDMIWSLQKNLPNENLQVIIFTASSGEEALSILEKTKIDLIVTDIRMPGISGIDLLIAVRNTYPDIEVIVMTAFPSSESKAEVMEKGGLRFIEKPFDIKEMRDSVHSALKMDSHFEGKMTGIRLTDIVQIHHLSQASTVLRINDDGREGVIYFSEGTIVHATCDDLVGEEAFYKLMSFKGGTMETFYMDKFPESTISTPVDVLLLKGTLREDERDGNDDDLKDFDPELSPASEMLDEEGPPAAIYEPELEPINDEVYPAETNNEEKEEDMDELKELLTEFTNIPGVNTACLVGRDGFLLHSVALSGIDAEMIGAIASSGFGASEAMGKQLQKGGMSMTMVEYDNGPVMFSPVGSEAFLVIIADKDANLGMIRLKIKKHARDIEQKAGI
ncbi:MAG: response regulator [Deltaproteobacteria bacterium]|nr:response regulator [Deltaproteobacteria bacterium]